MKAYYVYIATNRSGTLYVGVTNDLERRMWEHRQGEVLGFTSRYNIDTLVYFEETPDIGAAIAREKQIKSWRRAKKVALLRSLNPNWQDLQKDSSTSLGMTEEREQAPEAEGLEMTERGEPSMSGTLYVVATPIGNLGDISTRALKTLRSVDLILAEDTRVTAKLLARYDIKTPRQSYHAHTPRAGLEEYLKRLEAGRSLALATDAGTPGIQDPGGRIVEEAHHQGIPVVPIPGPSALTAALSAAGFRADTFFFVGFLPLKKGRRTALGALPEGITLVLYETAPRLGRLLRELIERFGRDREAWIGRELTKLHEETKRATLEELERHFTLHPARGEIVIILGPK